MGERHVVLRGGPADGSIVGVRTPLPETITVQGWIYEQVTRFGVTTTYRVRPDA